MAAAIFAMPARALAAEEPNRVAFRLEYTPPRTVRGCLGREDFTMWLASRFGYEVVRDDARALVHVEVKQAGRTTEAHVSARDEKGVERWKAVIPTDLDCRELIQDTAASIGSNLGNWHLTHERVPEWLLYRRPVEVGMPAPSPPVRAFMALLPPMRSWVRNPVLARVAETPESTQDAGARWEVAAAFLVSPYGLPTVGLGGGASVTLRWPAVFITGELRGMSTIATRAGGEPLRTTLWSGLVGPCREVGLRLAVCGLVSVGRLSARFDSPLERIDSAALSVMLGGRLSLDLVRFAGPVTLRLFGDAMIPLGQSRISVTTGAKSTIVAEADTPFVVVGISGSLTSR
ncbi:hypothetical protein [Polyangium aurulentum]|uniref:hypothetical protein n=1 Tax=Polyangium aurulentum TaxID=2567896 RepID=UPI0010ADAF45|nr:hypothetical protein [Polyangium aurulentum]UQA59972.1 hypothetical protein E8A73_005630 [Polyangium aurulentum]